MTAYVRRLLASILFTACHQASSAPSASVTAPSQQPASDADKQLVRAATRDKTEVAFTAPTAESVTVSAKSHATAASWDVDVVVNGAVVETVHTPVQANFDPIAAVATVPEGVLVIAGASKSNGKPDNLYAARVLTWDAGRKQLVVARTIAFEDQWTPGPADH